MKLIRDRLLALFADDVGALQGFAGRDFAAWNSYSQPS
mgnify:CR=1 FL=1